LKKEMPKLIYGYSGMFSLLPPEKLSNFWKALTTKGVE
jgi:hypothetical protein